MAAPCRTYKSDEIRQFIKEPIDCNYIRKLINQPQPTAVLSTRTMSLAPPTPTTPVPPTPIPSPSPEFESKSTAERKYNIKVQRRDLSQFD